MLTNDNMKKIINIIKLFWGNATNRQFMCEFLLQLIVVVSILIVSNGSYYGAIASEITFAFFSAVGTVAICLHFENKENRDGKRIKKDCIIVCTGVLLATVSLLFYFLAKFVSTQVIDICLIVTLFVDFVYYGISFFIRKIIKEKHEANKLKEGAR